MGGSQSSNTRRISVTNDDQSGVIKVSDSIVQRLKGGKEVKDSQSESRPDQEAALRENDQYWEKRLKTIEDNHKKINRRMEEEYKKATKEIEELFSRLPAKLEQPPCTNAGQHVKKCYQQNPREVLNCAKEVEAFAACVDMKRVNLLDSRQ
ncbi:MICOS complex subunit mic25-b [Cryptotermes secundus]|uniref:MICOS complex subunit mic25-b n=1 Tax=Cryptotermes secundus TaxID=105785 RepID=UPI000CD7BC24|nr:MICOS complex subunit mic25-b [Cryptotermes secundus]